MDQNVTCGGGIEPVSEPETSPEPSPIDPIHYRSHPSGIECIDVTEHMNFCLGNAIKYIWRSGLKGNGADAVADLQKARWYIDRELARIGGDRK